MTPVQIRPRDLGYRAEVTEAFAPYQSGHWLGRVAWTDRAGADVFMVTEESVTTSRATFGGGVLSDAASDRSRLPVVGDWVAVRSWCDDRSTVEAVLPRRTELACEEASRSTQESVVAANFDVVVIVEPVDAGLDHDRVDRLLRLARGTGARAVVALTSTDHVSDAEEQTMDTAETTASQVPVVPVSVASSAGVAELVHLLDGTTAVMVGPAGAAKSTLINAMIVPDSDTPRDYELVVVPGQGAIIATPGFRPLRLVSDTSELPAQRGHS